MNRAVITATKHQRCQHIQQHSAVQLASKQQQADEDEVNPRVIPCPQRTSCLDRRKHFLSMKWDLWKCHLDTRAGAVSRHSVWSTEPVGHREVRIWDQTDLNTLDQTPWLIRTQQQKQKQNEFNPGVWNMKLHWFKQMNITLWLFLLKLLIQHPSVWLVELNWALRMCSLENAAKNTTAQTHWAPTSRFQSDLEINWITLNYYLGGA